MNNFKNNYRRNRYRSNGDRSFRKRNDNGHRINVEFNNNSEFKIKYPRNNQNASKLIDKYNDLAREALSNGDKILSEHYLQHADHFSRILNLQEITKDTNIKSPKTDETNVKDNKQKESVKEKTENKQLNISD